MGIGSFMSVIKLCIFSSFVCDRLYVLKYVVKSRPATTTISRLVRREPQVFTSQLSSVVITLVV